MYIKLAIHLSFKINFCFPANEAQGQFFPLEDIKIVAFLQTRVKGNSYPLEDIPFWKGSCNRKATGSHKNLPMVSFFLNLAQSAVAVYVSYMYMPHSKVQEADSRNQLCIIHVHM